MIILWRRVTSFVYVRKTGKDSLVTTNFDAHDRAPTSHMIHTYPTASSDPSPPTPPTALARRLEHITSHMACHYVRC